MNAKQIKDYFEHPEKMDASALISLQQAVQDFPYAAALQMLYMKVLKNEDSYQLPAQVKRTAISVPDPSLLKAFYDEFERSCAQEHCAHERSGLHGVDVWIAGADVAPQRRRRTAKQRPHRSSRQPAALHCLPLQWIVQRHTIHRSLCV